MMRRWIGMLIVVAALAACGHPAKPVAPRVAGGMLSKEVKEALAAEKAAKTEDETWAALGRYEAACRGGEAGACWLYERRQRTAEGEADVRRQRAETLEPKCKAGDLVACHRIGLILDDDGGLPPDGERAFLRFEQACAGGYAYACVRAATFYEVSVPSQQPDAKQQAQARYRKACDAGFGTGCARLVTLGEAVTPASEAAQLEERACTLGKVISCIDRAQAVIPRPRFACDQCKEGFQPQECVECDVAACRRKSCCPTCADRNTSACCLPEAEMPEHPLTTVPVDAGELARARAEAARRLAPAARMLEAVCDAGDEDGCSKLAHLVNASRTLEIELERGPELWSKACRASKEEVCQAGAKAATP